ncbi:hypothetical protein [Streptomyces sp. NPDC008125]|uniref:hypothetical protein n=1 Tax=Streptomyces sp. NPDC008125 TaxID=3364811 RepID=UPI0036EA11BD
MLRPVPPGRLPTALLLVRALLVGALLVGALLVRALLVGATACESGKVPATKFREGEAGDSGIGSLEDVISWVEDAGTSAGAEVKNRVPSVSRPAG